MCVRCALCNTYVGPSDEGYLESLHLRDNLIEQDTLQGALVGLGYLTNLHVKGNPIEKDPKYRDHIILAAANLEILDQKKVLMHERQFLQEFYKRKKGQKGTA